MRNMQQAVRVLFACPAVIGLLAGDLTAQGSGGAQGVSPALEQRATRLQKERENVELQTSVLPFKAFDNLYYVGVGYVSSWLLTTEQGLILIDTLEDRYVDRLLDNIRKVGFDPKDIKYVVISAAPAMRRDSQRSSPRTTER